MRNVVLSDNVGSGLIFEPPGSEVFFTAENIVANGNGNGIYVDATGVVFASFDHLVATENATGLRVDSNSGGENFGWNVALRRSELFLNSVNPAGNGDIFDNAAANVGSITLYDHNLITLINSSSGDLIQTDGTNLVENQFGGGSLTTLSLK
jgi:hypothetical protein